MRADGHPEPLADYLAVEGHALSSQVTRFDGVLFDIAFEVGLVDHVSNFGRQVKETEWHIGMARG
jgi:hypothetical protein